MDKTMIFGIVRHLLTTAGGVLVAKGYIDAPGLDTVIGALIAIGGVGWSVWEKKAKPA